MKTVSVRELSQNGVSKAVAAAESEPILVTKNNEPSVWMVSAQQVALASEQLAHDKSVIRGVMAIVAVHLYNRGDLSIGRAARLAGLPLVEFIALAGRLHIPVLHEPAGGLEAELAGLEAALQKPRSQANHGPGAPEAPSVSTRPPEPVRVSALLERDESGEGQAAKVEADEYLTSAANLVV